MKMAHSMQGIYAPLPQSLSDSDSDKEISMEPICTSYNSKNLSNFDSNNRQNGHGLHLDEDSVKIKRGSGKMSLTRKIAFITSIVFCFLPIVIFLWVLPCSELHTCPVKIKNWEYQQEGVELKGPINLVYGLYKTNFNLVLLYKGSFNSAKTVKHGIISFMSLTGMVAWDFEQEVEPLAIDCNIIDTNNDGNLDCLVVDSKGLKAIETVSGQTLWHVHSSDEKKLVRNLDLPVSILDLNNDGIEELLSVFEKSNFLIISGRSGKALANIPQKSCGQIKDLHRPKNSSFVTFKCVNSTGFIAMFRASMSELESSFKNSHRLISLEPIAGENSGNAFAVGNKKLSIANGPNCPKCHCIVTLSDDRDQVLRVWNYDNAFAMNPAIFSFEPSDSNKMKLKGHLSGFIMKLWQWSEHYRKLRPLQRINRHYSNPNETLFTTEVTESVILITFNDSDINVINASSKQIKQICKNSETNCQPSVANQLESLLVEDLENDSSSELVNFYSSYVINGDDLHLVSYVKVLRLEEELPKLFGNK